MTTDVVIPVYNNMRLVAQCVDTVCAQDDLGQVIVVDDASTDPELLEYLQSIHRRVTVLTVKENAGFVNAVNKGMEIVTSQYGAIVNSDTAPVDKHGVSALVSFLHGSNGNVGGAKLIFMQGSKYGRWKTIQHAGIGFDPDGIPYHPYMHLHSKTRAANILRRVHAVTGAVMAVRMDVWRSIGGFDIAFSPGVYEDVDYCLKAGKVFYVPHSVWEHLMHGSQTEGHDFFENDPEHLAILLRRWGRRCDEALFYQERDGWATFSS